MTLLNDNNAADLLVITRKHGSQIRLKPSQNLLNINYQSNKNYVLNYAD